MRLSPAYAAEYDRATKPRWQIQATKALPRLDPRRHGGAVVSDMTPNYLCSPKALRNLAGSVGAPSHFRMLLLLRQPRQMLTASYKMFVRWGWVRSANLDDDVQTQLKALRLCNATLYAQPELLRRLPPQEVLTYFGRCWCATPPRQPANLPSPSLSPPTRTLTLTLTLAPILTLTLPFSTPSPTPSPISSPYSHPHPQAWHVAFARDQHPAWRLPAGVARCRCADLPSISPPHDVHASDWHLHALVLRRLPPEPIPPGAPRETAFCTRARLARGPLQLYWAALQLARAAR